MGEQNDAFNQNEPARPRSACFLRRFAHCFRKIDELERRRYVPVLPLACDFNELVILHILDEMTPLAIFEAEETNHGISTHVQCRNHPGTDETQVCEQHSASSKTLRGWICQLPLDQQWQPPMPQKCEEHLWRARPFYRLVSNEQSDQESGY